jgi:ubiquitin C-terminal hydrolase
MDSNAILQSHLSNILDTATEDIQFIAPPKAKAKLAQDNQEILLDDQNIEVKSNLADSVALPAAFPHALSKRNRNTEYVGLLNQGATCYLNSLLQSLFMTELFREALLQFEYNNNVHGSAEYCIPYQLQLLFARLYCSIRPSVDTKSLTHSFRWTAAQSFRQHDCQELMRVLFTALEKTLKTNLTEAHNNETQSKSLIQSLYSGQLNDNIRCLHCNSVKTRQDEYLDISLDVDKCNSLTEALSKFIQTETLTGDNQYRCSVCSSKQDAQKSLKFSSLPLILTFQLKRFIFDFKVLQRIKLTHSVAFDLELDMKPFLEENSGASEAEHVYELFAVLVHSGTAMGGHYYSYIRPDYNDWCEFNDANVFQLDNPTDWQRAFGGSKSSASAYMLIYRKKTFSSDNSNNLTNNNSSPADNTNNFTEKDTILAAKQAKLAQLPANVRSIIEAEDAKYTTERLAAEQEARTLELSIFHAHKQFFYRFDHDTTIDQVSSTILNDLKLDLAPNCVRLRRYDSVIAWAGVIFERNHTLQQYNLPKKSNLLLETKEINETWPVFNPNNIPLRFILAKKANIEELLQGLDTNCFDNDQINVISVEKTARIADVQQKVTELYNISAENQRIVKLTDKATLISDFADEILCKFDITAGQLLFLEDKSIELGEESGSHGGSFLIRQFEGTRCEIHISYNLPNYNDHAQFPPEYNQTIKISKNCTLRELKQRISPLIDMPIEAFRASLNPKSAQFKDDSLTLAALQLVDYSGIYLTPGRPLQANEIQCKFYLDSSSSNEESKENHKKFKFLFELPIETSIKVAELKSTLLSYLNKLNPSANGKSNGYGIEFMRIRAKKGLLLKSPLEEDKSLAAQFNNKLDDGQEFCIQRLDSDETIPKDCLLLQVQHWDSKSKQLHPAKDLIVKKMCYAHQLREQLAEILNREEKKGCEANSAPLNPLTSLAILLAKGKTASKMKRSEMTALPWLNAEQLPDKRFLKNPPLLMKTGDLFVFTTIDSTPPKNSSNLINSLPQSQSAEKLAASSEGNAISSENSAGDHDSAASAAIHPAKPWQKSARPAAAAASNGLKKKRPIVRTPARHRVEHALVIDVDAEIAAIERVYAQKQEPMPAQAHSNPNKPNEEAENTEKSEEAILTIDSLSPKQ